MKKYLLLCYGEWGKKVLIRSIQKAEAPFLILKAKTKKEIPFEKGPLLLLFLLSIKDIFLQ